MLIRLVNAVFFVVLLFAEQVLAQEPVKENRAESLCFGQCGGTGLIHGLEVGTYFRRPLLPAPPDVQLPSPPYGPKTWSPWAVCLSLGSRLTARSSADSGATENGVLGPAP